MSNSEALQLQVKQAMDSWVQDVLSKNVERIGRHYAAEIVAFDAIKQLQFKGRESYIAHWQACMEVCSGPGSFAPREPTILLGGDLALVYFLCHCGGTDDKGQTQSSWMRVTQGYRQRSGQWLIVHEHFSAPFDMQSGQALFDLQP